MVCLGGRFSGCGAAGGGGSGEGAWLQENQMDSGGRCDYHAWRPGSVWLGRVYEEISRNRAIKVKKYEEDLKKNPLFLCFDRIYREGEKSYNIKIRKYRKTGKGRT